MSEGDDNSVIMRPCPLYATTPLKLFGMDVNSVVGIMVFSTFIRPFIGAVGGMVAGYIVVYIMNKASKGQPSGYLFFRFSNWACSAPVRRVAPWFSSMVASTWKMGKSLPPSGFIKKYHR